MSSCYQLRPQCQAFFFFFFNDTATTEIYTLSLHDALPILRTAASGLDRDGRPLANSLAPNDLAAKVTVLAEGTRGMLSQAWCTWQQVTSENPQLFALGVKELWETRQPLDTIVHTLGWPLPSDAFGGSFMYPIGRAHV